MDRRDKKILTLSLSHLFLEISPFIKQDPPSLSKSVCPVTPSVTTLAVNTVLSRPPALVQVAQLPAATLTPSTSLTALNSDTQLETLLDGPLGPDTERMMEELHPPLVTMEVDFSENIRPAALKLHSSNVDNMDWLDLTLSVPTDTLDMSTPVGVFSSDFLESHELL